MSSSQLTVGGPIESRCTKCRKVTNHIVVAIAGGTPAKVKCNTCDGEHKYRPPVATKRPSAKKTAVPKTSGQKEWQEIRSRIVEAKAVDYSMNSSFKVDTVIKHPVFGIGLVEKIVAPRIIEVLFEDGRKRLRCL